MTNGSEIAEYSDIVINCGDAGLYFRLVWVFIPYNTNISDGTSICKIVGYSHSAHCADKFDKLSEAAYIGRVTVTNKTSVIILGVLASDSGRYGCEDFLFWRIRRTFRRMGSLIYVRVVSKYTTVILLITILLM